MVEFYEGDGSYGAAVGAGIGARVYKSTAEAFRNRKPLAVTEPVQVELYENLYQEWKQVLQSQLSILETHPINQSV
jgi:xylulokinase